MAIFFFQETIPLSGGWYYPTGRDGQVSRDLPRKPCHSSEDHGDSLCYLIGRIAPDTPKYAETRVRDQFDPTGYIPDDFFPVKTYKY